MYIIYTFPVRHGSGRRAQVCSVENVLAFIVLVIHNIIKIFIVVIFNLVSHGKKLAEISRESRKT